MITLTSPQLLKLRSRTLLLHIKALDLPAEQVEKHKVRTFLRHRLTRQVPFNQSDVKIIIRKKTCFCSGFFAQCGHHCFILQQQKHPPKVSSNSGSGSGQKASKSKLKETVISGDSDRPDKDRLGCDWLNELSITVRRCKAASLPNARLGLRM